MKKYIMTYIQLVCEHALSDILKHTRLSIDCIKQARSLPYFYHEEESELWKMYGETEDKSADELEDYNIPTFPEMEEYSLRH